MFSFFIKGQLVSENKNLRRRTRNLKKIDNNAFSQKIINLFSNLLQFLAYSKLCLAVANHFFFIVITWAEDLRDILHHYVCSTVFLKKVIVIKFYLFNLKHKNFSIKKTYRNAFQNILFDILKRID